MNLNYFSSNLYESNGKVVYDNPNDEEWVKIISPGPGDLGQGWQLIDSTVEKIFKEISDFFAALSDQNLIGVEEQIREYKEELEAMVEPLTSDRDNANLMHEQNPLMKQFFAGRLTQCNNLLRACRAYETRFPQT